VQALRRFVRQALRRGARALRQFFAEEDLSSTSNDLVEVEVYKHHATDKAIKVSLDGEDSNAVFVPISKIEEMKPKSHGILMITLPEWMAIEKGLV
jgi:hypothetical protein